MPWVYTKLNPTEPVFVSEAAHADLAAKGLLAGQYGGTVPNPATDAGVDATLASLVGRLDSTTRAQLDATYGRDDGLPGRWVGAYGGVVSDAFVLDATWTSPSTVVQNHQIALDCTDLRVVLPFGWKLQASGSATEAVMPNGTTVKVAVQIGSATYPVTFRGQRSVACDPGGCLVSDPLGGIWAKGTQIKVRILNSSTSGLSWPSTKPATGPGINPAFVGNGFTKNADIVDATTAAGSANAADNLWGACLLGRPLTARAFVMGAIGDSITDGSGDTGGTGYSWITRATNAAVPLFRYTRSGILASGTAATPFYSMPMLSGCSHVVVMLGANDLGTLSTYSQIAGWLASLYRMVAAEGAKPVGVTILPKTTSTDGWVTTGNQAAAANGFSGGAGSIRSQLNAWIRAGADGLLVGYVEAADAVETARDSGIWKANYTADGLHPASPGHAAIAAAVDLAAIAAK